MLSLPMVISIANSIIIFYTSTEFAVVFVLIVQYSFTIIILIP